MPSSTAAEDDRPKARLGVFELDPQARELTKHGVRLKVQDQPIQIVSREELPRRLIS